MQQTVAVRLATLTPDYTKITDINVRKALAYAYPYEDVWLASGEVPGVTRIPANSVMPPGMAGKKEYFADGEQFTYNPEKAKELLAEAGYEPDKPYPITMIYYEVDPLAVAAQKQLTKGFERPASRSRPSRSRTRRTTSGSTPTTRSTRRSTCVASTGARTGPSGLTMLPPLLKTGAVYNTAVLRRAGDRRRDGRHRDHAARGAG